MPFPAAERRKCSAAIQIGHKYASPACMYACSEHASPGQSGSLLLVLRAASHSVLIIYSSHVGLGLGEKWAGLSVIQRKYFQHYQ